jgi:hypothetical protein
LIAFRWAEGQYERLPALAAELVALRATVIVAAGGVLPILAAKSLSSTIQRPRGCGAPEERDEFVAVHSITSSEGKQLCWNSYQVAGLNCTPSLARTRLRHRWRGKAMWIVFYVATGTMLSLAFVPLPTLDE